MKQSKKALAAGFSLCAVFFILTGADAVIVRQGAPASYGQVIAVEMIAFGLPSVVFLILRRTSMGVGFRFKAVDFRNFPLILNFSVMVSLLSFLLNYGASLLFQNSNSGIISHSGDISGGSFVLVMLAIAVVPAVFEEIYMRGALLSAYESNGGLAAIAMSGMSFAMIHASLGNFLGPLAAGCLYAYLTIVMGSVFPAIFAHLFNNAYYLMMGWLLTTYSAFGIWPYFIAISAVAFLLFLYLTLRSLEKALKKERLAALQKGQNGPLRALFETILSPGFFLFAMLFFAKTVLMIWE